MMSLVAGRYVLSVLVRARHRGDCAGQGGRGGVVGVAAGSDCARRVFFTSLRHDAAALAAVAGALLKAAHY
jgi:hypothetical protein